MLNRMNRRFVFAARPAGLPDERNFALVEEPAPIPGPKEILVRALYLSVDPYMRIRMTEGRSYTAGLSMGETMMGGVVGQVIESNVPAFPAGSIVEGDLGWQEYAVAEAHMLRPIDPELAPISTALGVLGMPGMTAYFAFLEVGRPKPGDTVVVSGAAGAVGQIVGQLAKLGGCTTVGIAGSDDKLAMLRERMGFDAAINYKTTPDLAAAVARACPHGVDVYFDNVGSAISEAVFPQMALFGRVVLCGLIAQYSRETPEVGPREMRPLLYHRVRLEGFQVDDWRDRYPEALRRMAAWIRAGKLTYTETITDGFENTPRAFAAMMRGSNLGKAIVRVAEPG